VNTFVNHFFDVNGVFVLRLNSEYCTSVLLFRGPLISSKQVVMSKPTSNDLTALIPGYIAPMTLDSSSLDLYRRNRSELITQAQHTDSSTKQWMLPTPLNNGKGTTATSRFGYDPTKEDSLKSDIHVLRNRQYWNRQTFYKKADRSLFDSSSITQRFQMGTVIEGTGEFFSSRLTKKERKETMVQEIMMESDVKKRYVRWQHEKQQQHESTKKLFSSKKANKYRTKRK
jgi:Fcf2 pre-rRNA processing